MISRRDVLTGAGALALGANLPAQAQTEPTFAPRPGGWRKFEVVTRVEIAPTSETVQVWLPLPEFAAADWHQPLGSRWESNANVVTFVSEPKYGARMLHAAWNGAASPATLVVTSQLSTLDRATDFSRKRAVAPLSAAERDLYLKPTDLIATDGLVRQTADRIIAGAGDDVDRARAIYEWVVDNTFRNPATRGCGIGDIAGMLKSGDLSGKCADLNALYVGLARAAGLPARDVYGLRVAPSKFGYKSLGANSATVSKAQHCRAEVWLEGFGWVPVDPADVRKVVLEEPPGKLALDDPKVAAARRALFGAWETNWLAYNAAHDLTLPNSRGPRIPFLMYPQAEVGGARLDSLDPDAFRYVITAREIV